jgi:hypothetical protein
LSGPDAPAAERREIAYLNRDVSIDFRRGADRRRHMGVIPAGATLTVDGSVNISDGVSGPNPMRTIDNFGTIEWVNGNIGASDRLTLHNRPGALIDIRSNGYLGHNANGRILINEGTLRKSGGGDASEIRMRLENTGAVDVHSGTLAVLGRGGFSTGDLVFDAGTTLEFPTAVPPQARSPSRWMTVAASLSEAGFGSPPAKGCSSRGTG